MTERIFPPRPLGYIEAVLAIVVIAGGLYLLSPLLIPSLSPVALALKWKALLLGFSAAYEVTGCSLMYGIVKGNRPVRKWSLFAYFCFMIFTQLLGIMFNGLLPPRWLSPVALGIIGGILYLNIRREEKVIDGG